MTKAYKASKRTIQIGARKGETVYNAIPVSYGVLTTEDVAEQIAAESTASPGDVKAVLDRYAHYVVQNLKKGYSIELLGFGTLYIRFITGKGVDSEKKVTASLIKGLIPGFRPSFKLVNKNRVYDLIPSAVKLVKYNGTIVEDNDEDDNTSGKTDKDNPGSNTENPGSSDSGNSSVQ